MKPASLLLALCLLTPLHAQLKTANVSAPTRLDWAFAVRGFGPEAGKVPPGYDSTKQKYQVFVPPQYKPNKAWPLIAFISPGDNPSGWNNLKAVCEKEGVFFCSPFAAGNPVPAGQRTRIILDMVDDLRRNYRIDPDQTYLGGFSGGGRMACAIAYSLPEIFAGVLPVCGTNPFSPPTYLRQRLQDRVSVAFITGETDFNRKENEIYMAPWFQELGIRSKLWVVPKLAHAVPSGDVMAEVYAWLKEDVKRRQEDSKARKWLAVSADEAPDAKEQGKRLLAAAEEEFKLPSRIWHGVTLLQGVTQRWPRTDASKKARERLTKIQEDEKILDAIGKLGTDDEVLSLSAQAKALERFGQNAKAIEAWELLAKNNEGTPLGKKAQDEIRRIQAGK